MAYKNMYQVENEVKRLSRKILNTDLDSDFLESLLLIVELNNIEWSKRNQKSKLTREIDKAFKKHLKNKSYSETLKFRDFKSKYIDLLSKCNKLEFT